MTCEQAGSDNRCSVDVTKSPSVASTDDVLLDLPARAVTEARQSLARLIQLQNELTVKLQQLRELLEGEW